MRKRFIILKTWLFLFPLFSEISFRNSETKDTIKSLGQKINEDLKKSPKSSNSLGDIKNLKVEGALFKPFSLCILKGDAFLKQNSMQKETWQRIFDIIKNDLKISGDFLLVDPPLKINDEEAFLKQFGIEGLSKIDINFIQSELSISISNKNLSKLKSNIKKLKGSFSDYRRLAHQISQAIFEEFIGSENLFLLQIAAVKRAKGISQIVLMDFDGQNEKNITEGKMVKSSPFFGPDGKSILYTVISSDGQGIVEQDLSTRKIVYRTKKPGLNIDARVTPNNQNIIATLSFGKEANIFLLDRMGNPIKPLTKSLGLNLSPSINSTSEEMVFVSTRSGSPQIYLSNLNSNEEAQRLTFQGSYNQTPVFSPDGQMIAFTGRDEKNIFDIFLLDKKSKKISRLTENQGRNQEPVFTPSGRYIIFISERDKNKNPEIYLASLKGQHQVRLTFGGSYFSPVVALIHKKNL